MALLDNAAQVAFLVASAAVFMHVSARFWIGKVRFRRAVATVLVLFLIGLALAEFQPPLVLSLVFLVTAALVTIQIIYEVGMKESVLIVLLYMVITAILGAVAGALLQLVG